jgi:hypothetical protein
MPAHRLPQYASYIWRRDNNMPPGLRVIYQLLNKGQWLVDVFDYLNREDAIEHTFGGNLFDASNKYLCTRRVAISAPCCENSVPTR